jgi:aldose 1-epimerase
MSLRYTVTAETRGEVEVFILREADVASAAIVPAWGNNCFMLQVHEPVLESVAFEEFRARPTSYGIPILFPFPNRLRDGAFLFRGQRYVVNPNRHGFVRDKAWRVLNTGASAGEGAWITSRFEAVQYAAAILQQFPFPFCFDVTYRLREAVLSMETVVHNTGAHDMPMGFGIHPYFRCPGQGTVCVPARQRWELEDSLPTGKLLAVDGPYDLRQPRDVTSLVLDDIYTDLVSDTDGLVRCTLQDQQRRIQTTVAFNATQFPHVVIYTPPAPRQAICIEPYTCPTDGLNLQARGVESNLLVLQPGETHHFLISVATYRTGL